MKDCTEHMIQMTAYTGDELDTNERLALENHLSRCGDCRDELAREWGLRHRMSGLPPVVCPDHVVEAIMAQTQISSAPQATSHRWWSWSAVAVAAVLAVLFLPGLTGVLTSDSTNHVVASRDEFTAEEVAQAKRDVIATLALAAEVVSRSGESTMTDIFGTRLPKSLSGSLLQKRGPQQTDAQSDESIKNPNASPLGGNG
ncbi:MAG: anti-sigma factor RsiW [Candidatus Krumholzibacteriia bacterium]|jgi:anti-sigma factor RsiW